MHPLASHFVRRFELYLATATAALFTVIAWMVLAGVRPLYTGGTAWASLLALQIAIQWVDRERQRRLRAKAIHEIREMLTDRVLNQLSTLKVWAAMTSDSGQLAGIVSEVDATIDEVTEMVTGLSEEQLDTWQLRYANSDAHHFTTDRALA
ncbi:hypothetical protein [Rubrivirga sp.]|uniref:hypothetical protein n=1 Tax=Rubrivirga sp. TaxID=1885344 RepID=UPI003B52ED7B